MVGGELDVGGPLLDGELLVGGSLEPGSLLESAALDESPLDEWPLDDSPLDDELLSLEPLDEPLSLDEEELLLLLLELLGSEQGDECSEDLGLGEDPELEELDDELLFDELEPLDWEPLLDALSLDWLPLDDGPLELLLDDELLELLEGHSQSRTRRSKRHSLTLETSRTVSVRLSTSMHSWHGAGVKRNSCTVSPGGGGSLELLLDSDELSLLELLEDELLDELEQQSQQQQPASWLCSHGPSDLLSVPPSSLIVTSRL